MRESLMYGSVRGREVTRVPTATGNFAAAHEFVPGTMCICRVVRVTTVIG